MRPRPPPSSSTSSGGPPASGAVPDRWVQRRIGVIWFLLFFNVLAFRPGGVMVLPITQRVGQLLTAASLGVALLLALSLNRHLAVRSNALLALATVLAVTSLVAGVRLTAGGGALIRSFRLSAFLTVLWLLSPWWGRRDMLLARCHYRALLGVSALVLAGVVVAPSQALGHGGAGRLIGVLWPVPAPQVAEYAALAAGMSLVLWLAGRLARTPAFLIAGLGVAMILTSRTRTALIGLVIGVVCAGLTMFRTRRRVRRVVTVSAVAAPLAFLALAPAFLSWFSRDQSSAEITGLTGRMQVWAGLLDAPRSQFNRWFGFGLSDKSFNGLSIDSTWLAAYHDQGLIGVVVVVAMFVVVLVAVAFRPPGPERALATFLAVYCLIASYTEVGLGDASPYLLTMVVAASLLAPERGGRRALPA